MPATTLRTGRSVMARNAITGCGFRNASRNPIDAALPNDWQRRSHMTIGTVRTTRSAGMLLLSIWLILSGVAGFAALPIPGVIMAALALIAGILILLGM